MLKKLFVALLLLPLASAFADVFPSKTLRIIVPNPPGGSTDLVARRLAAGLATELGQSVVVENRGGASGMVGAQAAMSAPPDGYTLFFAPTSVMAINPAVVAKLPYDPLESFAPVSLLSRQPLLIAVTPSLPANTLPELVALAKAKPGHLNFAGTGHSASLPLLAWAHQAGVKLTEIPYAGGGPGLTALIAGQVEIAPLTLGTVYQHVQAKKIRGLAVTSPRRSTLAPELPTVAELGFPGYEAMIWNGLAVPRGTPRDVIARLNRATVKVMASPEITSQFAKDGIEIETSTPEAFGEYVRSEIARWKKVASDSGIKPQ
jgi:tripartite-type tricarboxylate transporter receptor subunit TctC